MSVIANCPDVVDLGTFTVNSDTLIVSDPCYSLTGEGQTIIKDVKQGLWRAYVNRALVGRDSFHSTRNWAVFAVHEGYYTVAAVLPWEEGAVADIAVDSGQAGIFDINVYNNDDTVSYEPKFGEHNREYLPKWYSACSELTLNSPYRAGVVVGGVVSAAGFGDGGYRVDTVSEYNESSKIVAVRVVFIEEVGRKWLGAS